jgi:CRISPR-associated Cas5-like protein
MKAIQIIVQGKWAHFKRPETNNNPLSHDLITKTALIGLIGAVLGKEREEMKLLFPQLSEDFLYGVQLLNPVKKISWGFTSRTAFKPWEAGSPKYFEFLKNPKFRIAIALRDQRSEISFLEFLKAVRNSEAIYTPVLGWHNCPASIEFYSESEFSELRKDKFEAYCFVGKPPIHTLASIRTDFRVGFDSLPTYQKDFWNYKTDKEGNLVSSYKEIIYPDANHSLSVEGEHYEYKHDNSKWWLI